MDVPGLAPKIFPRHPQLQRDELLSSWIVALAKANRTKVHALCRQMQGNSHTVWNRDVDRLVPTELVTELSQRTLVPESRIKRSTLADLCQIIDVHHHPNGSATWVLPLGVWHRKRRQYGTQFCSICLRMDRRPYVRRAWRLAYCTECEDHGVLLMDRCPRCGAPFEYFRSELGHRNRYFGAPISVCSTCGFDMAYAATDRLVWDDWHVALGVKNVLLCNDFGFTLLGKLQFCATPDLMLVLRQLISVLSSPRRCGALYDVVACELSPLYTPVLYRRGLPFERRSVLERRWLFGMAVWLLLDWPERFLRVVASSRIYPSSLTGDMRAVPDWYGQTCRQLSASSQMSRRAKPP